MVCHWKTVIRKQSNNGMSLDQAPFHSHITSSQSEIHYACSIGGTGCGWLAQWKIDPSFLCFSIKLICWLTTPSCFSQVVFRQGDRALQVLPPLVGIIPEARLNLVRTLLPQHSIVQLPKNQLKNFCPPPPPQEKNEERLIKLLGYQTVTPCNHPKFVGFLERWLNSFGNHLSCPLLNHTPKCRHVIDFGIRMLLQENIPVMHSLVMSYSFLSFPPRRFCYFPDTTIFLLFFRSFTTSDKVSGAFLMQWRLYTNAELALSSQLPHTHARQEERTTFPNKPTTMVHPSIFFSPYTSLHPKDRMNWVQSTDTPDTPA